MDDDAFGVRDAWVGRRYLANEQSAQAIGMICMASPGLDNPQAWMLRKDQFGPQCARVEYRERAIKRRRIHIRRGVIKDIETRSAREKALE